MKLTRLEIEGYRSIRERLVLHVERNVTVVLGPNDHGKTNLLNAIRHINDAQSFDDDDLNWDSAGKGDSLPLVGAQFVLSKEERDWLLNMENKVRDAINRRITDRAIKQAKKEGADEEEKDEEEEHPAVTPAPVVARQAASSAPQRRLSVPIEDADAEESDEEESDDKKDDNEEDDELPDKPLPALELADIPSEIMLSRRGVKGHPLIFGLDMHEIVQRDFKKFIPRVELIDPITRLSDSVSAEELSEGKNEFMRGIFHYAGLNPNESASLFEQTDRTQMTINRASEKLNCTLRESWSQGKDLQFRLTHNSKEKKIELQIEDPSVSTTFVRASRRSSGFTHYFSLKTILNARQKDHPAESYILLFDEPGVFLHPSGQFDLLQVLETLATESQILYVTHSLFMINKTFPTRHRLLMKNANGTTLDGKPYVGRWQAVIGALGMTLTGSILFANHVILTEGDSDPIYIYAIIQKAVSTEKSRLDINSLAVMSTSESKHADVLLRLLLESKPSPRIAMITDGDKGGKERLRFVQSILKENKIPEKQLQKETSIEDHIPLIREVYVPAVAVYTAKLRVLEGKAKPDEQELIAKFVEHFDKYFEKQFEKGKVTQGLAEWAATAARDLCEIEGKPSKVGIAREYAARLFEPDCPEFKLDSRAKALIDWIHEIVRVPELHAAERKVLED